MPQADSINTTLERFAALYAEREAFAPTYEAMIARREKEIARRTGIQPHWNFRTEAEAEAHLKAMREVDQEIGFNEINDRMEALDLPLDRLVRRIVDQPASDLASLALKANAVATAWPELWRSIPDDLDWPDELLRDLIESVCIVAGVEIFTRAPARPAVPRSDLN